MAEDIFPAAASEQLVALARQAGKAILDIYRAGHAAAKVQLKGDESPLTAADIAAHRILAAGLPGIEDIPVISEESELPEFAERAHWMRYWLIDPLDGTREFLQRNDEFTVNIALIERGVATLGVVHVPVRDVTYLGINPHDGQQKTARKYTGADSSRAVKVRSLQIAGEQHPVFTVLASHRYGTENLHELLARIELQWPGNVQTINAGSSLKFCLIAEGAADFYPRLAPTSEWDTAAAQAVLEAAGGAVIEAEAMHSGELKPLRYNSRASIINPFFYALGDSEFDWLQLLKD